MRAAPMTTYHDRGDAAADGERRGSAAGTTGRAGPPGCVSAQRAHTTLAMFVHTTRPTKATSVSGAHAGGVRRRRPPDGSRRPTRSSARSSPAGCSVTRATLPTGVKLGRRALAASMQLARPHRRRPASVLARLQLEQRAAATQPRPSASLRRGCSSAQADAVVRRRSTDLRERGRRSAATSSATSPAWSSSSVEVLPGGAPLAVELGPTVTPALLDLRRTRRRSTIASATQSPSSSSSSASSDLRPWRLDVVVLACRPRRRRRCAVVSSVSSGDVGVAGRRRSRSVSSGVVGVDRVVAASTSVVVARGVVVVVAAGGERRAWRARRRRTRRATTGAGGTAHVHRAYPLDGVRHAGSSPRAARVA